MRPADAIPRDAPATVPPPVRSRGDPAGLAACSKEGLSPHRGPWPPPRQGRAERPPTAEERRRLVARRRRPSSPVPPPVGAEGADGAIPPSPEPASATARAAASLATAARSSALTMTSPRSPSPALRRRGPRPRLLPRPNRRHRARPCRRASPARRGRSRPGRRGAPWHTYRGGRPPPAMRRRRRSLEVARVALDGGASGVGGLSGPTRHRLPSGGQRVPAVLEGRRSRPQLVGRGQHGVGVAG